MKLKIAPEYVDLHQRVMKEIEADGGAHWNQASWMSNPGTPRIPQSEWNDWDIRSEYWRQEANVTCDTKFCYAGWAVTLAGYQFDQASLVITENGHETTNVVAARLLGLNEEQEHRIFYFESVKAEGSSTRRHPTVDEMKARVSQVTGINFD